MLRIVAYYAAYRAVVRHRIMSRPEAIVIAALAVVSVLPFGRLFTTNKYLLLTTIAVLIVYATSQFLRNKTFVMSAVSNLVIFTLFMTFVAFHIGLPEPSELITVWHGMTGSWAGLLTTGLPATSSPEFTAVPVIVSCSSAFAGIELALRRQWITAPVIPSMAGFVIALLFTGTQPMSFPSTPLGFAVLSLVCILLRANMERAHSISYIENSNGNSNGSRVENNNEVSNISTLLKGSHGRPYLRVGVPVVAVTAVIAVAVGNVVPFVSADNRYDLHRVYQPPLEVTDTVSPLAQVRGQLTDSQNNPLFRVTFDGSPETLEGVHRIPVAILDQYDGVVWGTSGRFAKTGEELPKSNDTPTSNDTSTAKTANRIIQHYELTTYRSSFLPALERPEQAHGGSLGFDRLTGQIISLEQTKENFQYEVTSNLTQFSEQQQKAALPGNETDVAQLTLPPSSLGGVWPNELMNVAAQFKGVNRYDSLKKMEQEFRSTDFGYSPQATPGHSLGALSKFFTIPIGDADKLTARIGYAEQFAAGFAVLARVNGFPSRVVVGYRLDQDVVKPGNAIVVRPNSIDAWPEVHFNGLGWVAFDPTNKTERAAQSVVQPTATTTTLLNRSSPTTLPGSKSTKSPLAVGGTSSPDGIVLWPFLVLLGVVLTILAIVLAKYLRRRKRKTIGSPSQRILGAWLETRDLLRSHGVAVQKSTTVGELSQFDHLIDLTGSETAAGLLLLAPVVDSALYAPEEPDETEVEVAWETEAVVAAALNEHKGRLWKMRATVDPRTFYTKQQQSKQSKSSNKVSV